MQKTAAIRFPGRLNTQDGSMRRVGVEIEFIGLSAAQAVDVAHGVLGGTVNEISEYEYTIAAESGMEWKLERDQQTLKEMGRDHSVKDTLTLMESAAEAALRAGSRALVPLELVGPPLPMKQLAEFQTVVDALADSGAVGTHDNVLYAFGLQFNPELPALDAGTITRYLQAFCCLQDWLFSTAKVDGTRQLTLYADPFETAYIEKIINPRYAPTLAALIDDYLDANPTRNRALDMLPLFAYLDDDRVSAVVDDPRIKSRPTFHYRLPNSEIGRPGWSIYEAWNDWVCVEQLANNDALLRELCGLYLKHLQAPLSGLFSSWDTDVAKWLKTNRLSA